MSRARGPRLYWHNARGKWVIRDSGRPEVATGTDSRADAERALAAYIAGRDRPTGPRDADQFTIDQALTLYATEHAVTVADPARIGYAVEALSAFWRDLPVSAVKAETCRRYAISRTGKGGRPISPGTVRRELGVLRAALAYCHREGYLLSAPPVTLPERPPPKERWLTRDEAARLLRAALKLHRGAHLARFILVALYTGTRRDAILRLQFGPNADGGWVDVDQGVIYRRGETERQTRKRRPPARLPSRLLAHLRRWARTSRYVVEYQGARCGSIKTAWAAAIEAANLPGVTPHTLRHTAITWAMQGGARAWDAASFFGASIQVIESTYGHHSPDHQESARKAMDARPLVRKKVAANPQK